jgi:hypothetical protein
MAPCYHAQSGNVNDLHLTRNAQHQTSNYTDIPLFYTMKSIHLAGTTRAITRYPFLELSLHEREEMFPERMWHPSL